MNLQYFTAPPVVMHGGAVCIPYIYDNTQDTNNDPGNGKLRFNGNQGAETSVTAIDSLDADGTDWADVTASLGDSTSTVKGHVLLIKQNDPTKFLVYAITSLTAPAGWRQLGVTFVGQSGSNPFTNGDRILFLFSRTGDKGE